MTSDEQSIRDLIETWHRATADGDVERTLPLMSEDVVFLVAGLPPMRGRDAFAAALRGLLEQHRVEARGEIQEIEVSGALAYCWSYLAVTVTPRNGGAPKHRQGHVLTILRRGSDGEWVVIRDANLLVTTPSVHPSRLPRRTA